MRFRTFAVIAVVMLAVSILTWGPWNTTHVAPNPGPNGTPGSTALDPTPPPAATTTGAARRPQLYQPLVWFEAATLSAHNHNAGYDSVRGRPFRFAGLRNVAHGALIGPYRKRVTADLINGDSTS